MPDPTESYEKQMPDDCGENSEIQGGMQNPRSEGKEKLIDANSEVGQFPASREQECSVKPSGSKGKEKMVDSDSEDGHFLGSPENESSVKQGAPAWFSDASLMGHHTQSHTQGGHDATQIWCPVCASSGLHCICGMLMRPPGECSSSSYANQSYAHWLSTEGAIFQPHQNLDELGEDPTFSRSHLHVASTEMDLCQDGRDTELIFMESMDREDDHSNQKIFDEARKMAEEEFFSFPDTENANEQSFDYQANLENELRKRAEWESEKQKAMIVAHPLYPNLLAAHVACLRVGTPADLQPFIDEQVAHVPTITRKYSVLSLDQLNISPEEKAELDQDMVEYISLLTDLQQHLEGDVADAMSFCWNMEQELYRLTGASPVYGTGATMSDEEDEKYHEGDFLAYDPNLDAHEHNTEGFGPLEPENRIFLERVRQKLKAELKEGYGQKIREVRDEILRKRIKSVKLPEAATSVMTAWWNENSQWPYPTEKEKEEIMRLTGLKRKQVIDWFINRRKRLRKGPTSASRTEKINAS